MEAELKARPNRLGIYVAAAYVLIVVGVFALTASAKPSGLGYEWIPFIMLAMPWVRMGRAQEFLIPGLIANVVIAYLLGTLLEMARRRIFQK